MLAAAIISAALLLQALAVDSPVAAVHSLLESRQLPAAEQRARDYLAANPNSADAHFLLGYVLFKKQEARASLAEYTAGAKFRTPGALDFETIGADYVLLHDYPDADKWFTRSLELDPQNLSALYYLGRTKYNENLFEEAVKVFTAYLKLDPGHVKAQDNLGLSYQALAQSAKAESAFRSAIAAQAQKPEKDPGPFLNLGVLLSESDRFQEAETLLLQAIAIEGENAVAHRALGKMYLRMDRPGKAQPELERSAQLDPQNAPIHFMLAQVYRKLGLSEKSRSETARYAELAGTHSAPTGRK